MTQVERILSEIEALEPQEQDLLFEKLADFDAHRKRRTVRQQKERLAALIGIADGETEHPDHDQTLGDAKLKKQE